MPATTPAIVAPPEKMKKADLTKHLRDHHHWWGGSMTKADLVMFHDALHEGAKLHDMGVRFFPHDYHVPSYADRPTEPLPVEHLHGEDLASLGDDLTDEQRERLEKLKLNEPISDKPLTAAERTVLKQLVDNDFARTAAQIKSFAAEAIENRKREISEEWADRVKAANKYVADAHKAMSQAREKYEALAIKAQEDGVALNISGYRPFDVDFTYQVKGLDKAIHEAEKEIQGTMQRALLDLEEQRLVTQARILRSALTDKTAAFLETLPNAQQLMVEAQATKAQTAIES